MKSLVELLKENDEYHSKSGNNIGTDKEFRHKYCSDYYDKLLLKYKDKQIYILEVGTGHGGSLLLWNDYFTNATIFGVDVSDQTYNMLNNYNKIKCFIANAYDINFANSLPNLDIAIDDGPHTLESFISFLEIYIPKINAGGLLIIEDIPDENFLSVLKDKVGNIPYDIIDTREKTGLHDNISFIVYL